MTNPYIIDRRASSCESIFPRIDARRMDWLASVLRECDRPNAAQLAASWAAEYRMLADRLDGITPIGACEDDDEITASAIAFGGPLPTTGEAA